MTIRILKTDLPTGVIVLDETGMDIGKNIVGLDLRFRPLEKPEATIHLIGGIDVDGVDASCSVIMYHGRKFIEVKE